ncbi:hypothetical protein NLL33_06285 [Corynebacterium accolens]|uniref:hypothetical protein n=1 Tax=Corynebacterium accolens TaxID=38284 RepID=UPI00266F9E18|nr:hypothetical protein [Corynebacterium accolens]WKS65883.1 hypothetical protein NLL33_06285 [Corynebacterium accolens]
MFFFLVIVDYLILCIFEFTCIYCLVFEVLGFLFLALGGSFLRKLGDVISEVDGLDGFYGCFLG